ncbi:hypothetical protein ACP6JA_08060 [Stutzerimonas frequens]|uniref:hypothetical protein n=1 Tax=Stutzerimonas frequens TaxID=2968969 RepID=UPI000D7D725D|nr:hypothetical protein [Stutzerimonas frequens]AWT11178.1 hypothetical protein DM292_13740 [Stutzerimonas frequens]MDL0441109.1 hypothetical protein [Stutzerimonas frequens]WCR45186.1 hypothetical protein OML25_04300 [Stutzerimonas stutzeri]WRW28127.1 hypothetical protein VQ574_05165 [Stutzerimonas frequens]
MMFYAQSELILAPALLLNALALVCALCGGWLLVATQWRIARASSRAAQAAVGSSTLPARAASTARINQAFYRFGAGALALALGLSMASRML